VYQTLTTIEGLSSWWTTDTIGSTHLGDSLYFTFGEFATFEMQVALLNPNQLVSWKFLGGNPDWDGTYLTFILSENEGKTKLEFVHEEFQDDYDHIGNINFSWGQYLNSLRLYCETGKGSPFGQ
tara:strand:- start:16284 stop:16655 length:372 start_codon:yes stop_codon:yes gene_type:complete